MDQDKTDQDKLDRIRRKLNPCSVCSGENGEAQSPHVCPYRVMMDTDFVSRNLLTCECCVSCEEACRQDVNDLADQFRSGCC